MKASCERFRRQLDARLDDELSRDERAELEQHLDTCEACSSFFEQAGTISNRLTALGSAADVIASTPGSLRVHRSPFARPIVRIAAAIALLAAAGLAWRFGPHRSETLVPRTQVAILDTKPEATPPAAEATEPDGLVVATATPTLAVRMKSNNPRVQIVMFYEPIAAADAQPLTTAPNL